MNREYRYVVLKISDIKEALLPDEAEQLSYLQDKASLYRIRKGKEPLDCVIVESDWPEYEIVWSMIEARVDGAGFGEI